MNKKTTGSITSKLLIHVPVDGPHGDFELLRQFQGCLAILGHVSDFPDLVRGQLVVSLRTFLEFFQIPHGDQPVPAKLNGRKPFISNQNKHALRSNAQDFTGLSGGEIIHMR